MDVLKYKCPLCQDFFVFPIRLNCNHAFCHNCVIEFVAGPWPCSLINVENWACPRCKTKITGMNVDATLYNQTRKAAEPLLTDDDVKKRMKRIEDAEILYANLIGLMRRDGGSGNGEGEGERRGRAGDSARDDGTANEEAGQKYRKV